MTKELSKIELFPKSKGIPTNKTWDYVTCVLQQFKYNYKIQGLPKIETCHYGSHCPEDLTKKDVALTYWNCAFLVQGTQGSRLLLKVGRDRLPDPNTGPA